MGNKKYQIKTIISLIIIFVILSGLLYPQFKRGDLASRKRAKARHNEYFLLFALIFCMFLGVISSAIATYKGRNNWCWFFLGMIPPWGLLLILFLPRTQEAKENDAFKNGDIRKCPYCAELIKTEAVKCKHCGEQSPDTNRK